MIATTLLVGTALAGAIALCMRPGRPSDALQRVIARQAAQRENAPSPLLRLRSDGCRCGAAELLGTRRFDAASAPPLPLPHSKRMDCRCRYEAVPERRREQRRQEEDRRGAIRLDDGRRLGADRRTALALWDGAL
jgi:hypothetical protein